MTLFKLFSFSAISLYYTSAKTFEKDNSEAWDKDKRRSGECDKGLSNSQTKVSHTQTWSLENTFSLWGIESFCNTTMRCINPDKFKLNHHDLDRWVIPIICVSTSFVKTAERENYLKRNTFEIMAPKFSRKNFKRWQGGTLLVPLYKFL